jgi:hypothetical protein
VTPVSIRQQRCQAVSLSFGQRQQEEADMFRRCEGL